MAGRQCWARAAWQEHAPPGATAVGAAAPALSVQSLRNQCYKAAVILYRLYADKGSLGKQDQRLLRVHEQGRAGIHDCVGQKKKLL